MDLEAIDQLLAKLLQSLYIRKKRWDYSNNGHQLFNIRSELVYAIKLLTLAEICLSEFCYEVCIGKYLSHVHPNQLGLNKKMLYRRC